jgi:hypothetical protein
MIINNYKQFEQSGALLLPPHNLNRNNDEVVPNQSKLKMSELVKIYTSPIVLGNKINSFCENEVYLTIKDETGINLISQQEPMIIFGVEKNREITIGPYNGIVVDEDSIVIYVKSDQSLYFLSLKDEYYMTFTRPKVQISNYDPFGEENWNNND